MLVNRHIDLDRSSWSLKSVCNRIKCSGRKMLLKQNTMTHTNMPRNCLFFLFPRRLNTVGHLWVKFKWPTYRVSSHSKRKTTQFQGKSVWIISHVSILHLKQLSNHTLAFYNGYKRFLQTNSSDPRHRVPFKTKIAFGEE